MQAKTLRKLKYKAKSLARSASAYGGGLKLLKLLERAEGTNKVSNIVANDTALFLLQKQYGNF